MSRSNRLGQVRRSQVLGYGPGAIIDFRAGRDGGGPISVIAASLESWDETARPNGANDPQIIYEERLQRVLGKQFFRLPPVDDSDDEASLNRFLRGYRFPSWLQCPVCKELKRASQWAREIGDPSRWCAPCSAVAERRVFAVPTRFVTACENSHVDEFPWRWWLRTRSGAAPAPCDGEDGERVCKLHLESVGGSGLEGLVLSCRAPGCGARASMGGAFSADALKGLACTGRRPWLTPHACECTASPRTLQRGASNLYFPVTYSTLSIPPWSDRIQEDIRSVWEALKMLQEPVLSTMIQSLGLTQAAQHGMTPADFEAVVRQRLQMDNNTSLENLRVEEYVRLTAAGQGDNPTFQVKQEDVPASLADVVERIARVERLREVRALTGFKRIYQPVSVDEAGRGEFGDLCNPAAPRPWLPAAEVRGEGIFVSLRRAALEAWIADHPAVVESTDRINVARAQQWALSYGDAGEPPRVTPVLLLIHSLAHALIKRLSFECGYDAASLRERLYVGQEPWMAGLLIYTSTSDADGTLGGLERQGKSARFEAILRAALHDAVWCSSDPLCREGISSTSENLNLAACHSCLLLPETSCEEGNRFLDRGMLVGAAGGGGFFDTLVSPADAEI